MEPDGTMAFPNSARVLYKKNPLEAVICQLRFPPILRIESEPPAPFQEAIRSKYPLLEERALRGAALAGLPEEIAKVIGESFPALRSGSREFQFSTADEHWKLALTREVLALTARKYERWEEFEEHLGFGIDALSKCYSPAFFTRVGLRYRNVIVRSDLAVGTRPWRELLKPHIAGVLSSPDLADKIEQALHNVVISIGDRARVQIQHGLGRHKETGEELYLIDADFYTEQRTEVRDVTKALSHFNREAGRLFRWCIEDSLHRAMEPSAI